MLNVKTSDTLAINLTPSKKQKNSNPQNREFIKSFSAVYVFLECIQEIVHFLCEFLPGLFMSFLESLNIFIIILSSTLLRMSSNVGLTNGNGGDRSSWFLPGAECDGRSGQEANQCPGALGSLPGADTLEKRTLSVAKLLVIYDTNELRIRKRGIMTPAFEREATAIQATTRVEPEDIACYSFFIYTSALAKGFSKVPYGCDLELLQCHTNPSIQQPWSQRTADGGP
ncbi:hypothetical protein STEG23_017895 [Scotinomys teguina]